MKTRGIVRVLAASSPPSARLLEVLSALGMGVTWYRASARCSRMTRSVFRAALRPCCVTLITGPSGSGKSTLMHNLHARLIAGGANVACADAREQLPRVGSLLDALGRDAHHAASCLAAAGLADATLWVRSPSELSEGEKARFVIARAFATLGVESEEGIKARGTEASRPCVLLIDECCSTLDRTTARSVCTSVARAARRDGFSLVCASAHDDIAEWLTPDFTVAPGFRPVFAHETSSHKDKSVRSGRGGTQRKK